MSRSVRSMGMLSCAMMLSAGYVLAQPPKANQPATAAPSNEAAMAAMQKLGSPSEGHKALEPLVGTWTYTAQWWMAPDAPPEAMTGRSVNSLVFGGRFLKQEIQGEAQGQPPFEGLGFTGYDNIRKEYQTVWFDNMATGMMVGNGQFDAATNTLTDQGEFSCPMTGETHRMFRSVVKTVDPTHYVYESYMRTSEGREYKAMEILYTRAQ